MKKILVIIVFVASLAAASCGVGQGGAEKAARQFLNALVKEDSDIIYDLLADESPMSGYEYSQKGVTSWKKISFERQEDRTYTRDIDLQACEESWKKLRELEMRMYRTQYEYNPDEFEILHDTETRFHFRKPKETLNYYHGVYEVDYLQQGVSKKAKVTLYIVEIDHDSGEYEISCYGL